jgi:hypothetical protein
MRAWIFIAALSLPCVAHGKCAARAIEVTGTLLSIDGSAAAGVPVSISWSERGDVHGPLLSVTNDRGEYAISFWFNTYSKSGFLRSDICREELKLVSLGFAHPSGSTHNVYVCSGGEGTIRVPPVRLPESAEGSGFGPPECGG